jgi:hypothetical protein
MHQRAGALMSVYSFLKPLQAAVYAALVADVPLMESITGVYDLVPPDAVCPYLALTLDSGASFRTKTRNGQRILLTVTVFSAEAGFREAQGLAADVVRILCEGTLALDGAVLVMVQPQTVALDFDAGSRKVTARLVFQAIVQEAV